MKRTIQFLFLAIAYGSDAQDSTRYQLLLDLPLLESAQNLKGPYGWPSMNQASSWSTSLYDLSFYGLHRSSAVLFRKRTSRISNAGRKSIEYLGQLAISRYASELPIPLGIWAHEEFHRAVLKTAGLYSFNGNWLFSRWNGTVYGVSDQKLKQLKNDRPEILLYSYVAGVHAELVQTQRITLEDFSYRRHYYKSALLLYNSWYVFNYFRFSVSPLSDTVSRIATEFESQSSIDRDFAGADLTAWVWDMFNPERPYDSRQAFPGGEGVNRRIGFSQLNSAAQNFLLEQKRLSLLNFLNPSIIGIHRIGIGQNFSFLPFVQYYPLHFGSCKNITLVMSLRHFVLHASVSEFKSLHLKGQGLELGIRNEVPDRRTGYYAKAAYWQQPPDYFAMQLRPGFSCSAGLNYKISPALRLNFSADYKSRGWQAANPYLDSRLSLNAGLSIVTK